MNLMMVRARLKEENVAEAQAATQKVIQALDQARPADVRYASSLLSDGVTFVALPEMERGQEHPLRTFPVNIQPYRFCCVRSLRAMRITSGRLSVAA